MHLAEESRMQFIDIFKRFESFQKETGLKVILHGYTDDIELRHWANRQRGLYHSGRLPQWKEERLQDCGLLDSHTSTSKSVSTDSRTIIAPKWMMRYKDLESYYHEHGHSRIPRTAPQLRTLANWVWTQQAKYRKSELLPEQIRLLDSLELS